MKTSTYNINLYDNIVDSFYTKFGLRSLLRDREDPRIKGLEFHIDSGDYFASLATILDLIRSDMPHTCKKESLLLKRATEDLLYLQRHYEITKKI